MFLCFVSFSVEPINLKLSEQKSISFDKYSHTQFNSEILSLFSEIKDNSSSMISIVLFDLGIKIYFIFIFFPLLLKHQASSFLFN